MIYQNDNERRRPQDDLPYERRMYYIIKDYRRLLDKLEEIKAYAHSLESDLKKERDKRALLAYNNRKLSEKKMKERRGKRRLFEYIGYLMEKYDIPISEKPVYESDVDYEDD